MQLTDNYKKKNFKPASVGDGVTELIKMTLQNDNAGENRKSNATRPYLGILMFPHGILIETG
jgi:hypothetical protein